MGYASGYTSYFMGKEIAFKETLCEAMGHDHCHIIGKTVDEWEGETDLERSFLPDSIEEELFSLRNEINELKQQNHHDLLSTAPNYSMPWANRRLSAKCAIYWKKPRKAR